MGKLENSGSVQPTYIDSLLGYLEITTNSKLDEKYKPDTKLIVDKIVDNYADQIVDDQVKKILRKIEDEEDDEEFDEMREFDGDLKHTPPNPQIESFIMMISDMLYESNYRIIIDPVEESPEGPITRITFIKLNKGGTQ